MHVGGHGWYVPKHLEAGSVSQRSFSITPIPPFRLDLTVWALRRRPENAIDRWDGRTYRRILIIDVKQWKWPYTRVAAQSATTGSRCDRLKSYVAAGRIRKSVARTHAGNAERLETILQARNGDPRLQPLVEEFRGLKPPQFPTVFEAVANGIACQQLSLHVGILLLGRLSHRVGLLSADSKDALHAFPDPTDFSGVKVQSLKSLGFSANKSQALMDVSSAIRDQRLNLESLIELDNQAALERLVKLKRVGRWTAEYVLLRGLGRLDIFPGDDVGARNKLAHFLRKKKPLDYDGVRRAVADWQPYAGFVYFHLLLARIKSAGWLSCHQSQCAATQYSRSLDIRLVAGKRGCKRHNTDEFDEKENVMKGTLQQTYGASLNITLRMPNLRSLVRTVR